MGGGGEGSEENSINGAGAVNYKQVICLDGAYLRYREWGSDRGDAGVAGGVTPLDGLLDIRDVRSDSWGGVMGVVISGRFVGGGKDVPNEGIHSVAAGYRCGVYHELSHL